MLAQVRADAFAQKATAANRREEVRITSRTALTTMLGALLSFVALRRIAQMQVQR